MNYHSSEFPEVTSSPLPEPVVPVEYRAKLAESGDTDGKGDKATDALAASSNGQRRWMSSISGRRWLIIIGVILVVVVIIALGTSLGVVLSKRNGEKDSAAASRAATGSSMPASSSSFTASSPAASIIALSTIGEMHGTATLATPVPYPSPNAWPNQNYVLYCISPLRKVERRWSWTDGLWYPINSFEDHGGIVSDIQPGVGVTMSVPAPGWPLWEDLTVIGSDNQVYRRRWNGTQFLPWLSLGGGDLATGPTTTAFADGREGVFVVGKNGELYTFISELEQVPQSSDQWSLNMTAGSWEQVQPTTVRWGFNKLSVFLVARDGMLYYKEFTDSISGEIFNLGGVCTSRVAAVSWGSNNISVFVRGGDGGLWWTTLTGTAREWNSWESLSGSIQVQGEPETVSISFTSVKVFLFAWGTDGSVLYKMFDGESWTPSGGFDSLNLTLAGPPKASSKQEGELQLFGYSSDGRVLSKVYNETEGGWSSEVIDLGEI